MALNGSVFCSDLRAMHYQKAVFAAKAYTRGWLWTLCGRCDRFVLRFKALMASCQGNTQIYDDRVLITKGVFKDACARYRGN